jgi:hypothetical protein
VDPAIDRHLTFFYGLADLPPRQLGVIGLQPFVQPQDAPAVVLRDSKLRSP